MISNLISAGAYEQHRPIGPSICLGCIDIFETPQNSEKQMKTFLDLSFILHKNACMLAPKMILGLHAHHES